MSMKTRFDSRLRVLSGGRQSLDFADSNVNDAIRLSPTSAPAKETNFTGLPERAA